MKHTNIFRNLPAIPVCIVLLAVSLFSCKQNDVDESGNSDLKVVNASPDSPALSFDLAGKTLVSTGLIFADATTYIQAYAGTRLVAEFRNTSSGASYATGEVWLYKDKPFTVFVAGESGSTHVHYFDDDLSSPDSGKARVRFIHLSDDAPSDIRIEYTNGDDLVTNLSRYTKSGYKDIAAGSLAFQVYGTAQSNHIGDYEIDDLTAGKIYTIYLAGISSTGTTAHSIVHN